MSDKIVITPRELENARASLVLARNDFRDSLGRVNREVDLLSSWQDELSPVARQSYEREVQYRLDRIPEAMAALDSMISGILKLFSETDDQLRKEIWDLDILTAAEHAGVRIPLFKNGVLYEYYDLYEKLQRSGPHNICPAVQLFGGYSAVTLHYINNIGFIAGTLAGVNRFVSAVFGRVKGNSGHSVMNNPKQIEATLVSIINNMHGGYEGLSISNAEERLLSVLSSTLGLNSNAIREFFINAEQGAAVLNQLSKDFGQHIAMLESLRSLNSSRLFQETLDSLIKRYERNFGEAMDRWLVENGISVVVNTAVKFVASPVKVATFALDATVTMVPGLNALDTVIGLTEINNNAMLALQRATETIASGNFTSADVAIYRNAFEVVRGLQIAKHEAMLSDLDFHCLIRGSTETNTDRAAMWQAVATNLDRLRAMEYDNFIPATSVRR